MSGKLLRGCVVFCGLLLLWWLATRSGIPAFLLPSPSAVASALWVNRSYLGEHTLITLSEILSGLVLGALLGVTLALCMIVRNKHRVQWQWSAFACVAVFGHQARFVDGLLGVKLKMHHIHICRNLCIPCHVWLQGQHGRERAA